jgi:hypothetical protein
MTTMLISGNQHLEQLGDVDARRRRLVHVGCDRRSDIGRGDGTAGCVAGAKAREL